MVPFALPCPRRSSCRPYALTVWPSSVTSRTPALGETAHFCENRVRRTTNLSATGLRHNAKSAEHVAAFHHRDEMLDPLPSPASPG